MARTKNKQIKVGAEPDSHLTTSPRSQPHTTSATPKIPANVGGGALPLFEFEFQVEKVDSKTGMVVEARNMK